MQKKDPVIFANPDNLDWPDKVPTKLKWPDETRFVKNGQLDRENLDGIHQWGVTKGGSFSFELPIIIIRL